MLLPADVVLSNQTRDGGMLDGHHLADADLANDLADTIANQRNVFGKRRWLYQ